MSGTGRNDPCPCGSGKKWKRCGLINSSEHQGSTRKSSSRFGSAGLSLEERTSILYQRIGNICGFSKGVGWDEFRARLTADQVAEAHKLVAWLWPPDTDYLSLLPQPDGNLRSLYVGMMRPELILKNIVRYSLYTDEILVFLPFLNPWCIAKDYNPIDDPEPHKGMFIRQVAFLSELQPWVRAGIVKLIPDPGDFDYSLRIKCWEMGRERAKKGFRIDKRDREVFDEYAYEDIKRMYRRLPAPYLTHLLKKAIPGIKESEVQGAIQYMRKVQAKDPLALNQEAPSKGSEFHTFSTGAGLEMAMYVSQVTGAYLYTDLATRWKEILQTAKSDLRGPWSLLTMAFQELRFTFLDAVDARFACTMRAEGRLGSFRAFLRRLWTSVSGDESGAVAERHARELRDELESEFQKAKGEWSEIDRSLLKWSFASAGAAFTAGHLRPELPALGFCIAEVGQLVSARMKRRKFMQTVPLSVFLDLERRRKGNIVERLMGRGAR